MGKESDLARRYESQYPGTGISEAQKAERQQRMDVKSGKSHFAGNTNIFAMPGLGAQRSIGGWKPT